MFLFKAILSFVIMFVSTFDFAPFDALCNDMILSGRIGIPIAKVYTSSYMNIGGLT